MEYIEDNKKTIFRPYRLNSFQKIIFKNLIFKNDVFEKYKAKCMVDGILVVCNDITKLRNSKREIAKETYEEYLDILSKRDPEKDKWIYNIIDGISEQESILYNDDKCIVIPSYIWDSKNIKNLHILCIPKDKSIRTIRSLSSEHIPLLKHMKQCSLEVIKEHYNLNECNLKMFVHYEPSTYHFHIHFGNVGYTKMNSSVEYSHELNTILFNLSLDGEYYKKIIMNKRV